MHWIDRPTDRPTDWIDDITCTNMCLRSTDYSNAANKYIPICYEIITSIKGEVSSKMTYSFYWPDRISIFFRKLFVIYFIKKLSLKSEV